MSVPLRGWFFGVLSLILLSGCGGGGSGEEQLPPVQRPADTFDTLPMPNPAQASRFLVQASFGPTPATINTLTQQGLSAWVDEQMRQPVSRQRQRLESLRRDVQSKDRIEAWWHNAMTRPDQLRQRVAFALSQILVVSERGGNLGSQQIALAHYYDQLASHAFGNFRDLLETVTLSPVMGEYLSMLGNEKPDPVKNIRPDENFARELMQLFTLGLVQLNPDGTPRHDAQGQPMPTYDQTTIEAYAHVFTGWTYANAERFRWPKQTDYLSPMKAWPEFHDPGEKRLLNGVVIPPGTPPEQALDMALDSLFQHPNVGPFIGRQLIQRLVTSNPSPAYVARVSRVFADNGQGVRGDMAAVVRAILLDEEAREGHWRDPDRFGKLKEPVLRIAQVWRAFDARAANGRYDFDPGWFVEQAPLRSPSVFNFYSPFYAPPGPLRDTGLVAPEFQITTEYTLTQITNLFTNWGLWKTSERKDAAPDAILLQVERDMALANDVPALLDHLDLLLLNGRMSDAMRQALALHLSSISDKYARERVTEAIALIIVSPEFALQL